MADFTGQNIQDTYQRVVQVDDNQLQDGTGSNLPISFEGNNVRISGSLIAQQYIVSSSVTNITTQQLSGSTEFGDSADDIHTFIGHVTASGNISSSGALSIKNSAVLKSHVYIGEHLGERSLYIDKFNNTYPYAHIFAGAADNNTQVGIKLVTRNSAGTALDGLVIEGSSREATFANVVNCTALNTGHGDFEIGQDTLTTSNVTFNQVTAASTISSSGTVIGNRLQTDDYIIGDTSLDTGILVDGYVETSGVNGRIIASSTISASGDVIGPTFGDIEGNLISKNDISASGDIYLGPRIFTNNQRSLYNSTGQLFVGDGVGAVTVPQLKVISHITASGNISASGNIYGDTYYSKNEAIIGWNGTLNIGAGPSTPTKIHGNVTASGNISASGDIIGDKILSEGNIVGEWNGTTMLLGTFGEPTILRGNSTTLNNGNLIVGNEITLASGSGHITASGNISASGNIVADYYDAKTSGIGYKLDGVKLVYLDNSAYTFGRDAATRISGSTIELSGGHVTASGNISSSGHLISNKIRLNNLNSQDYILGTSAGLTYKALNHKFIGNITASGDISSSGTITAEHFYSSDDIRVGDNLEVGGEAQFGNPIFSANPASTVYVTGDITATTNITASGNISASGYIYSTNEDVFQFSFQTDADTLDWHGCNKQGLTEYYWNKNYGDDNGVTQIDLAGADKRFMQAGWHVPYKCLITGWELLATGNKNNAPYTFTASLFTGDPISASIALHSDNSNDVGQILNLTEMHQSASLPSSLNDRYGSRYINAKGAMSYSLDAGQYVYPRVKHTTLDSSGDAQVNGNWTIYYRRIK